MMELNALLIDKPLRLPVDWDLNSGMGMGFRDQLLADHEMGG
jgi:hypothetical protein